MVIDFIINFSNVFSRFIYGEQAKFFEAEIKPRIKHKKKGTVSMANNGDNLHGSQVSCQIWLCIHYQRKNKKIESRFTKIIYLEIHFNLKKD